MTGTPPKEQQLLSIIRTQTEIAAGDLDLEAAMQVVADRAQELTGADGAIIQIPEGDRDFVFRVTSGDCGPFIGERLSRDDSLAGRALRERRLLESRECDLDLRVDRSLSSLMRIGSMICVPLFHRGDAIGVLTVADGEPNHFTGADRQALELMSDLMAAHMSHANQIAVKTHESRHDALTGLANRRAYEERLEQEISRAQRYEHPLSLCIFDLDGFKAINDQHGHPAGDEILRRVAEVIRTARLADAGFRIGGDEFALLLPEADAAKAKIAIDRLICQVESIEHPPGAGRIGVSYGIASGHADAAALHAAADERLLLAKTALYGGRRDRTPRQPAGAVA